MKSDTKLILRHAHSPGLSLHPHPKAFLRPRLAIAGQWAGELSERLATNRYLFYGSLILAGSLIVGAFSKGHETLWRSTAALGTATVLIGLLSAWLEARSARKGSGPQRKRRAKKPRRLKSVNP